MANAQRMSHADAAWLHMDADQPDGHHRRPLVRRAAGLGWRAREDQRRAWSSGSTRFRQRVTESRAPLSGPHWEDDPNFDLDLHFHQVALPAPGDSAALQELCGRPDGRPARPLQAALALVPRRRLRRRRRDGRPNPPLHRRWDRARPRPALADRRIAPTPGSRQPTTPRVGRIGRAAQVALQPSAKVVSLARDAAEAPRPRGGRGGKGPFRPPRPGRGRHGRTLQGDGKDALLDAADPPTALKGELGVASVSPGPTDPARATSRPSATQPARPSTTCC